MLGGWPSQICTMCYGYYLLLRRQLMGKSQVVRSATFGRDIAVTVIPEASRVAEDVEGTGIALGFLQWCRLVGIRVVEEYLLLKRWPYFLTP